MSKFSDAIDADDLVDMMRGAQQKEARLKSSTRAT